MATDQKIENLLNLALASTEGERERSLELDVGYDRQERTWDLIVKYTGDIQKFSQDGIEIVELLNEYAIVTIRESLIPYLAAKPEIEFIEKPKRLFFSVNQGRTASCMDALQIAGTSGVQGMVPGLANVPGLADAGGAYGGKAAALFGKGILIACIDSGVDYTHPDFRNPDGTTRILAIWDQTAAGRAPKGYRLGSEYTQEQINEALFGGAPLPTRDVSGHGTQVLGIAAGNGRTSAAVSAGRPADADIRRKVTTERAGLSENAATAPRGGESADDRFGSQRGVAPLASLLVVKLGNPRPDSFPKTTELMQAIDYVYRKAQEYGLPVALNLSFGNVYGPHEPYN